MPKKRTKMSCAMKCSCTRAKQCPKCAARENPAKTQAGRVLRIENCPPELASQLLNDRKRAERAGEKPPTRYGKCDYRAAEWALQLARKGKYEAPAEGASFTPTEGVPAESFRGTHWGDWLSNLIDKWW